MNPYEPNHQYPPQYPRYPHQQAYGQHPYPYPGAQPYPGAGPLAHPGFVAPPQGPDGGTRFARGVGYFLVWVLAQVVGIFGLYTVLDWLPDDVVSDHGGGLGWLAFVAFMAALPLAGIGLVAAIVVAAAARRSHMVWFALVSFGILVPLHVLPPLLLS